MDEHDFEAESPLFRMTLDDDGFSLGINLGEKKKNYKKISRVSLSYAKNRSN